MNSLKKYSDLEVVVGWLGLRNWNPEKASSNPALITRFSVDLSNNEITLITKRYLVPEKLFFFFRNSHEKIKWSESHKKLKPLYLAKKRRKCFMLYYCYDITAVMFSFFRWSWRTRRVPVFLDQFGCYRGGQRCCRCSRLCNHLLCHAQSQQAPTTWRSEYSHINAILECRRVFRRSCIRIKHSGKRH